MALIVDTIARAELVGTRVFSLTANWGQEPLTDGSILDIDVSCTLSAVESQPDAGFSIVTLKVGHILTQETEGEDEQKTDLLFEIEMHGAYKWEGAVDKSHFGDERVANMLGRPVYTAAVSELKRMSAVMDMGSLYLSPHLPWPDDVPMDLSTPK